MLRAAIVLTMVLLLASPVGAKDSLRPSELSPADWQSVLAQLPGPFRKGLSSARLYPVPEGGCEAVANAAGDARSGDELLEIVRKSRSCGLLLISTPDESDSHAGSTHEAAFDLVDGRWKLRFEGRVWANCFP